MQGQGWCLGVASLVHFAQHRLRMVAFSRSRTPRLPMSLDNVNVSEDCWAAMMSRAVCSLSRLSGAKIEVSANPVGPPS